MTDTDIMKACGEVCTDNRFELIAKYKQLLIDSTNIETAHGEMAVIDSILFRCWQMGWLDKLEEHNRQKAEIEAYKHYYNECLNDLKNAHVEIEELREINDCRTRDMPLFYATAIREFAERVKPKLRKNAHVSPFASNLNDVIIDNLVKEMTEGT